MQPDDKDAALLPRRIDGSFALLHRPMADSGAHIWISYSPDLRNWGGHRLVLQARRGGWWDANKVGLSPPLDRDAAGLADALPRRPADGGRRLYRLGLALLDLDTPSTVLLRGESMDLRARSALRAARRRRQRRVPLRHDARAPTATRCHVYYGAADTSIGLATASVAELLDWLARHQDDGSTPSTSTPSTSTACSGGAQRPTRPTRGTGPATWLDHRGR